MLEFKNKKKTYLLNDMFHIGQKKILLLVTLEL